MMLVPSLDLQRLIEKRGRDQATRSTSSLPVRSLKMIAPSRGITCCCPSGKQSDCRLQVFAGAESNLLAGLDVDCFTRRSG
jgi:hypothetical protein